MFLRCTVATGNIYEENVDQSGQCVRQGENEGLEEISNNFEGRIDGSEEEIDDELQVFLRKKSYFLDVGLRKVMIYLMRDIRLGYS